MENPVGTAPIAGGYKRLKVWLADRISWSHCSVTSYPTNLSFPNFYSRYRRPAILYCTIFTSRDRPIKGFARYRHDGHY